MRKAYCIVALLLLATAVAATDERGGVGKTASDDAQSRVKVEEMGTFERMMSGKTRRGVYEECLPIEDPEEAEVEESFRVLLMLALLIVCFLTAFSLRQAGSMYLHESGASIMLGAFVGFIVWMASDVHLKSVTKFDAELFMIFLLPPIIFESGYNMNKVMFFKNIVSILMFALVGTLISTVVIGGGLWLVRGWTLAPEIELVECLVFGSLISATDPVTVLAIFKQLNVDFNLYSNCFGESVLNDAVAIVLYSTMLGFLGKQVEIGSVLMGVVQFAWIFVGSIFCGISTAVLATFLFKYTSMYKFKVLEAAMLMLYAYASYLLAEGLKLSGIVSILFCGITMAHYTRKNISPSTKHLSIEMFELFATMAETFVFAYLGLSIFSLYAQYDYVFIIMTVVLCFVGRAFVVFPLSFCVNFLRGESPCSSESLPITHQVMMWFSGLRGAIAFTLAIDYLQLTAENNVPPRHGVTIVNTTMIMVLFTVLGLGSFTAKVVKLLNIKTGETAKDVYSGKDNFFVTIDKRFLKPLLLREHPIREDSHGNIISAPAPAVEMSVVSTPEGSGTPLDTGDVEEEEGGVNIDVPDGSV